MQNSSPAVEIARVAVKLLAARRTACHEVPELIAAIGLGIRRSRSAPAPVVAPPASWETDVRDGIRTRIMSASPPRKAARQAPQPRRARPPVEAAEPAPPAPATPRLMRRADVTPVGPFTVAPLGLASPAETRLRGVVRWFDNRTRQGRLRLPGFEDVPIEASAVERAGLSRLFKGQEVEATIARDKDQVRLIAIALPGRAEAGPTVFGRSSGVRRHAKPVVVEMKRDALRRTAARIEAEHLLGNGTDR